MYPHWTEQVEVVEGVSIHYTRTGDGSKPPLVLVHGFSDDGMCWLPVARDLEAEYDLILPDVRGHGLSQRVKPGEVVDQAGDIAGLIRQLGLGSTLIGGHSMGANISAVIAATCPELVSGMILEDPPWRKPRREVEKRSGPAVADPWIEFLRVASGMSVEAVVAKCRADSPNWPEVELLPWALSKQRFDLNVLQSRVSDHDSYQDTVKAIRCPTLLVTADPARGAIVTPETAEEVCALNPLMREAHVAGVGHSIRREDYAAFMGAVGGFLAELRAR